MVEGALAPVEVLAARLAGKRLDGATWQRWMHDLAEGRIATYQHATLQISAAVYPLLGDEAAAARAASSAEPSPWAAGLPGIGAPDLWGAPIEGSDGDASLAPILAAKVRGEALSDGDIATLVRSVASGDASDNQVAAFTAAVFIRGMSPREVAALTREMTFTGDTLDLGALPGPKLDKHSTGGVGDKVSLPLAGVLAACGAFVPMVSGRGLGHTGGTLDKLMSIPGFRVDLSAEEIRAAVRSAGAVIVGQTADLAPADKRMYALRDVTATVSSIPLITASILSKKLAEGLDALCMDVKVGSGAFMRDLDDARTLAQSLVDCGEALTAAVGGAGGLKVSALLTAMDRPLGLMIGNALEVRESLQCLSGGGPEDLRTLVVEVAARLLVAGGLAADLEAGKRLASAALDNGSALERFKAMVKAQGGDVDALDDPHGLPEAQVRLQLCADRDGVVTRMDALALGKVVVALGGGRRLASDRVDPAVGLEIVAPLGAQVRAGQPVLIIHAADTDAARQALESLSAGITIGEPSSAPPPVPLIIGEV